MSDEIVIRLSADAALVLFEWLARSDEALSSTFDDRAEERVLSDIEAQLERVLTAPLDPNYAAMVEAARSRVRDSER